MKNNPFDLIDIHNTAEYKAGCVKLLTNPELSKPYFDCIKFSSPISGVYSIFDKSVLVYVESSQNMSLDMTAFRNHSKPKFISALGNKIFKNHPSIKVICDGQLFPPNLEIDLDEYLREHVTISLVPIGLSLTDLNSIKESVIALTNPDYLLL